mmetsp:Transcript_94782/g.300735  ORF Transcript_94782/g.300735 Transcript_94782/m.300735 type:complete len:290 (-) Transcript_94782:139-1008(-)
MASERRIRMTPNGSSFGQYLRESCSKGRACMPQGGPVPELVARLGILLHYAVDRASHWYCTDAPGSGVMLQRAAGGDYEYDVVLYMAESCNALTHMDTHYWEQGMGLSDAYLSPATVGALHAMHGLLAEFADDFRSARPEWFDPRVSPMDAGRAIGTRESPGHLYNVVRHSKAVDRVRSLMEALRENNLPAIPGWETDCGLRESAGLPVRGLAEAFARQLRASPKDCGVRALLGIDAGLAAVEEKAAWLVQEFDADGNGWLSLGEIEAWERDAGVERAYARCGTLVIQV